MEVQFHSMQAAGVKHGCSLVYRVIGQDFAYRKGQLIALSGSIIFITARNGNPALGLKIATLNALDKDAVPEHPYFAYIETPHGTTAKSKVAQADSPDTPGARMFTFQLDEGAMRVMEEIVYGSQVKIGFNRQKDGMDVLVPLDLSVIESTASETGFARRHSDETLSQFSSCVLEVTKQAKERLTPN